VLLGRALVVDNKWAEAVAHFELTEVLNDDKLFRDQPRLAGVFAQGLVAYGACSLARSSPRVCSSRLHIVRHCA
jgi:hypothetical protein